MAHDEASKNHQGGLSDNTVSFEKLGRMYQTEHPNDGYNALRLYLEKLNPECRAFFQYPKRSWKRPQEGVWFENRCLGVNKLGDMMKILSKSANLSKIYTNQSVTATAIALWSDSGLSNRMKTPSAVTTHVLLPSSSSCAATCCPLLSIQLINICSLRK
ncbi:unnamed protein product [Porites lobata]|uniref:Uncharacterized protein n=1 Tax=Porites lobata TaxID=104759 RepID=A0ABN8NSE8_9CNID|nr:unnamed protein product [Porites lobata]